MELVLWPMIPYLLWALLYYIKVTIEHLYMMSVSLQRGVPAKCVKHYLQWLFQSQLGCNSVQINAHAHLFIAITFQLKG